MLEYLDGMKGLDHEIMYAFGFDGSCRYTLAEDITEFSENDTAQISMDKLFKRLKESKSSGLILVHNHPSGVCVPTEIDVKTTKSVMEECSKRDSIFIEHFTYTNGLPWGIKSISIDKNIYLKDKNVRS